MLPRGKTGNYLHAPEHKVNLSFETGGVPRSFSVIAAVAYDAGGLIGTEHNGIAILDNDLGDRILDRHLGAGTSGGRANDRQIAELERISKMNWPQFSAFCRSHPRFSAVANDLCEGEPVPQQGSASRQIALGLLNIGEEADLRSPALIAADEDPNNPYSFPAAGRMAMIRDLMRHDVYRPRYEAGCLSWNVRIDMIDDWTGTSGEVEVNRALDARWEKNVEADTELFERICETMRRPYLEGEFSSFSDKDSGRWGFDFVGRSGGQMRLVSMDGGKIAFDDLSDMGNFLEDLSDEDLRDLWEVTRVLDHDLSREARQKEFLNQLNYERAGFEEMQDEPDPASLDEGMAP